MHVKLKNGCMLLAMVPVASPRGRLASKTASTRVTHDSLRKRRSRYLLPLLFLELGKRKSLIQWCVIRVAVTWSLQLGASGHPLPRLHTFWGFMYPNWYGMYSCCYWNACNEFMKHAPHGVHDRWILARPRGSNSVHTLK